MYASRRAFTLIELLVVIAIIAILAVVVVLTLNPAELLRQSRDSNRVSDMATLTSALGVYSEDQASASSFSLGSSSVVYVSIPDSSATSTAGTNCASLGLPTLPSTYSYHCAASSTYRNVNGSGWIPVNFSLISSGSPLGNLPVDPTNNSSSRLYYTYATNGTQYETTAAMESQKYGVGGSNDVISNDGGPLASVYEKGSKLGMEPLDYGDTSLVGYWPLNEGTNTIAYDDSGNNATGSWSGTQTGTNGYYSTGQGGGYQWAGAFDGNTDYVNFGSEARIQNLNGITFSLWIDPSATGTTYLLNTWLGSPTGIVFGLTGSPGVQFAMTPQGGSYTSASTSSYPSLNSWSLITGTYNGTKASLYINGILVGTGSATSGLTPAGSSNLIIGKKSDSASNYFPGLIDDVRIYNRALSAAQIAAMYSGGK